MGDHEGAGVENKFGIRSHGLHWATVKREKPLKASLGMQRLFATSGTERSQAVGAVGTERSHAVGAEGTKRSHAMDRDRTVTGSETMRRKPNDWMNQTTTLNNE
ncbi:hypothetical protein LR48_Vigan01g023000 [Vigna angularis]|uniref:Uncharacterized protein n=1 Tax=Phaseolus angularis TaxID=3914 RepID=A0A0L9TJM5_PHAAN|nr:hypothetical protein LR48_Vigan01g023000 [Vigna angularis]